MTPTPYPTPAPYPPADIMSGMNYFADLVNRGVILLPRLVLALIIFLIGIYIAKLVSKIARRALEAREIKLQVVQLMTRITYWSIVVLVTTIALQTVGFNLTAFLTGLGILGFTVGFALQDVSKNFIAGLLLLLSQPFEIGDAIQVAGYTGVVQNIELRATELKMFDGNQILIPNADVFSNPLTNFSRNKLRRIEIQVGVAYGTDLEKARQVAVDAVRQLPGVLEDPAPLVVFNEFADSTINFSLFYWIDTSQSNFSELSDSGFVSLEKSFAQAGIVLPFPSRTVYLPQQSRFVPAQ
jgi:small conductance mechanosensitive channel